MATGNIIGKVNNPISPITYTGEETDTASVIIDNTEKTIAVDVKVSEVTKNCPSRTETQDMIDAAGEEITSTLSGVIEAETSRALVAEGNLSTKLTKWFTKIVSGENIDGQFQEGDEVYCYSGSIIKGGDVPSTISFNINQTSSKAIYLNTIYLRYINLEEEEVEYSYTFDSGDFNAIGQTKEFNGLNWILGNDVTDVYFGWNSSYGLQVGSGSKPAKKLSLSTDDLAGCTLLEASLTACRASSSNAKLSLKAANDDWIYDEGGETETTQVDLPQNNISNPLTFTYGEGTTLGQAITIYFENTFLHKENISQSGEEPEYELIEDDSVEEVIYVNNATNKLYKYNGTMLVEISVYSTLELGLTSTTAYRGDYGQDNYNRLNALSNKFPPLTDQSGKCVVVNQDETGFEYVDGGTKLFKHVISFFENVITICSTRSSAYTLQELKGTINDDSDGVMKLSYYNDDSGVCYLCQWLALSSTNDEIELLSYGESVSNLLTLSDAVSEIVDEVTPL